MRAGVDLGAWLADAERQEAGAARSRAFDRDVVAPSPLGEFGRTLDRLDPQAPASALILDVLAGLHVLLADTDWVCRLVEAASAEALADSFFEPPFASLGLGKQQGLLLLSHPLATVSLGVLGAPAADAGARSIGFPGFASIARVMRGSAEVALWEADDPGADFSSASAAPCRRSGTKALRTGDLLAVDGRTQTFAVQRFESDLLLLRGEVKVCAAPLAREYDPHTLALVSVSSTDEAASRTALLLSLVRACDRKEVAPVIARIARGGPFYLRWTAVRELLALDPATGLRVLHDMARDDPHPEVRQAAEDTQRTLRGRYPSLFEAERQAA